MKNEHPDKELTEEELTELLKSLPQILEELKDEYGKKLEPGH